MSSNREKNMSDEQKKNRSIKLSIKAKEREAKKKEAKILISQF
jgi:hypothetical protein